MEAFPVHQESQAEDGNVLNDDTDTTSLAVNDLVRRKRFEPKF